MNVESRLPRFYVRSRSLKNLSAGKCAFYVQCCLCNPLTFLNGFSWKGTKELLYGHSHECRHVHAKSMNNRIYRCGKSEIRGNTRRVYKKRLAFFMYFSRFSSIVVISMLKYITNRFIDKLL